MGKRINVDESVIPTKKKKCNDSSKKQQKRKTSKDSSEQCSEDESDSGYKHSDETKLKDILNESSPRPVFQLPGDVVDGVVLTDIKKKQWRIGKPVGKGSFGEIFLASDNIKSPVSKENAKFVVKIEPHSNGPLFVEIHCLINVNKKNDKSEPTPPGVPCYIASGSHYFRNERYRFLVLPRFDRDLHSIIKHCQVDPKSLLTLAVQILDILQVLHDKGYCHSDIKAENLMISKCTYNKSLKMQYKTKDIECLSSEEDSNSSESKSEENSSEDYSESEKDDESEDDDDDDDDEDESQDEEESNETSDSESNYKTPLRKMSKRNSIKFSGSNPVRSCRYKNNTLNTTYQEMVNSHYLRPARKINYSLFFDENSKSSNKDDDISSCENFEHGAKNKKRSSNNGHSTTLKDYFEEYVTENRVFLIDYGLASKFVDASGVHRPFCMDQRRAHDGTLEFTSRDAHMGAHSRRSDLECLGYNLIFWSQGYLPWREKAALQQPEKVHGMKEYLMADVKQMLKHLYGKQVPKYLGEYMYYVGKLAYDERPDYELLKMIFLKEYKRLGHTVEDMQLDINELQKNSINIHKELKNKNLFEMKKIKNVMKNLGVIIPFQESNVSRVSPKNLRSKEKNSVKKKKKFSWAEILSQDPDQIARERAEKEFEREPNDTPVIRFKGKPTYAILEIQNRLNKFKERLESTPQEDDQETETLKIKGYNKQMIDVLKKKQQSLLSDLNMSNIKKSATKNDKSESVKRCTDEKNSLLNNKNGRSRAKEGLRQNLTPPKRNSDYAPSNRSKTRGRKKLELNSTNNKYSSIINESVDCNNITDNLKNMQQQQNNTNESKKRLLGTAVKTLRSKRTKKIDLNTKRNGKSDKLNKIYNDNNSVSESSGNDESSCSSTHSVLSSNVNSDSNSNLSSKKSSRSKSTIMSTNSNETSSNSSIAAAAINVPPTTNNNNQKILSNFQQRIKTNNVVNENSNSSTNSSSSCHTIISNNSFPPASLSDEDTRDVIVRFPPKNNIKNNRVRGNEDLNNIKSLNKPPLNRVRIRINGTSSFVKEIDSVNSHHQNNTYDRSNSCVANEKDDGFSRRKKTIPRKRSLKNEYLRCV